MFKNFSQCNDMILKQNIHLFLFFSLQFQNIVSTSVRTHINVFKMLRPNMSSKNSLWSSNQHQNPHLTMYCSGCGR